MLRAFSYKDTHDMNILSKVRVSDVIHDPFPHLIIENAIDSVLANQLLAEIPPLEDIGTIHHGNERISMGYDRAMHCASPLWRDFLSSHVSQEFVDDFSRIFATAHYRAGIRRRDSLQNLDILLDAQICANTPTTVASSVRGPHIDMPSAVFAGLWYLRDPRDNSRGGDLQIYAIKKSLVYHWKQFVDEKYVQVVKTIPYTHNTLVLFPNSRDAIHGVSVRQPTMWPRYFVNFLGDGKNNVPWYPQEGKIKAWWRGKKPKGY